MPAAINFTAEAKPDQVGSGLRAINTLFHEGGHAAHFANVVAELALLLAGVRADVDGLCGDAVDVLRQPGVGSPTGSCATPRSPDGEAIPPSLILERIASSQPMRAFDARSIAVVPYFESALYQMADDDLTPERRAGAGARDGNARARHREPAAAAGDSPPAQSGIGRVVPGISARLHGRLADARALSRASSAT